MGWIAKAKYVCRVLSGVRLRELNKSLKLAKERSGKARLVLLVDMLLCAVRYGAGYHDYVMFGFYDMDASHRDTYVTRFRNKRLITLLNDPETADIFDHKTKFNPRFKEYLGREFLLVDEMTFEDFSEFVEDKERIFAKPDVGESGKGIERLTKADFESTADFYRYIKTRNFGVIGEMLVQHEAMQKLYPDSVNSLRVVTLLTGAPEHREAQCVYAVVKIGAHGKNVDNLESGGMFCPIDYETGKITGVGHTSALTTLTRHPDTGVKLVGYKIPFVQEAIALCKKAALEEPEMRLVGWDCAITPDGPVLIEGNDYPGYDFWQQPEHTPDRIGLWPYYLSQLPELR